ncbi:MAG: NlpC/P60 family protein [Erythrobacter sp.]|uniref:NlpC/P60 family protein n=1 Tax=Erythrobacter sp. TaxID=1042 RepID=UPI003298352C
MSQGNKPGEQLARAASLLIGTRFQLHGRDPKVGLDCIGLVACSLKAVGRLPDVPQGYRLRNIDHSRWIACAGRSGLVPVDDQIAIGDIVLVQPGPGQYHLVIVESTTSMIHAHAGLRKVVRQSMIFAEKRLARWRLR